MFSSRWYRKIWNAEPYTPDSRTTCRKPGQNSRCSVDVHKCACNGCGRIAGKGPTKSLLRYATARHFVRREMRSIGLPRSSLDLNACSKAVRSIEPKRHRPVGTDVCAAQWSRLLPVIWSLAAATMLVRIVRPNA